MKRYLILAFLLILLFFLLGYVYRAPLKRYAKSFYRTHCFEKPHTEQKKYNKPKDEVWGLDISHHQGNINWDLLAEHRPHFIFLKATEGTTHKDTRYTSNKQQIEKLKIPVGAYHFFSYKTDGAKQAKHYLKTAKLKNGNLLPVLDCEYTKGMPNQHKVTKELLSFIETIEQEMGISPMIYCEEVYYTRYLKKHLNGRCPLWLCDFGREPKTNYAFWQQTDRFKHPAFKGTIDYNSFVGRSTDLVDFLLK